MSVFESSDLVRIRVQPINKKTAFVAAVMRMLLAKPRFPLRRLFSKMVYPAAPIGAPLVTIAMAMARLFSK